jgi:hypothetical protein
MVSMLRETPRSAGCEITGIGIGSTGPVYPFTGEIGDCQFPSRLAGEESGA